MKWLYKEKIASHSSYPVTAIMLYATSYLANAAVFITLDQKINEASIQTQPLQNYIKINQINYGTDQVWHLTK